MSIQKHEVQSKSVDKGTSSRQKRKVDQKSVEICQRNLRSSGDFCRFQQNPFGAGETAREKLLCNTYGKCHLGRYLFGTRICFKCRQEGHTTDRCLLRLA